MQDSQHVAGWLQYQEKAKEVHKQAYLLQAQHQSSNKVSCVAMMQEKQERRVRVVVSEAAGLGRKQARSYVTHFTDGSQSQTTL